LAKGTAEDLAFSRVFLLLFEVIRALSFWFQIDIAELLVKGKLLVVAKMLVAA
jgi:hypothetical protein